MFNTLVSGSGFLVSLLYFLFVNTFVMELC